MPTEVEAKFRSDGPEPLESLNGETRLGDTLLGPPRAFDEVDRYLDTADGRLSAARWACRFRDRGDGPVVSLKGPAQPSGEPWLHRRPELEGPAGPFGDPGDWPPSEARALLDELRGGAPMVERLVLRQHRTERSVRPADPPDAAPLGTLSLDVVTVALGTRTAGELYMVELELAGEGDEAATHQLTRLAGALARRPGLHPDSRTKLEHALELLAAR